MVVGQRNSISQIIPKQKGSTNKRLWVHASSLGEFEQARPVIEAILSQYPLWELFVTFYSPSGYNNRKYYKLATQVLYLPADTADNARQFVATLQPDLVIWVKYDFWFNFLNHINAMKIPLVLLSASPRASHKKGMLALFYRKIYSLFNLVFLQFASGLPYAEKLLPSNPEKIILSGDTRFDRVGDYLKNFEHLEWVEQFTAGRKLLVFGSAWPADIENAKLYIKHLHEPDKVAIVIVPHEIKGFDWKTLVKELWDEDAVLFSTWKEDNLDNIKILILDTMGMLARLYYYAHVAWVGGGFGTGLHNILEAAVYGVPVTFGPVNAKFPEAKLLTDKGGAVEAINPKVAAATLAAWLYSESQHKKAAIAAKEFCKENMGATKIVMDALRPYLV